MNPLQGRPTTVTRKSTIRPREGPLDGRRGRRTTVHGTSVVRSESVRGTQRLRDPLWREETSE